MSRSIKARIKPELLIWTRENAGYSIELASQKIKVNSECLISWEKGEDSPTISKLRQISKLYKFPLSVFYLDVPPKNFQVMHDFRKLPEGLIGHAFSPALKYEIRTAQQRRELALELYSGLNEKIKPFNYFASIYDNPEEIGMEARDILNIRFDEQASWKDSRTALNNLRYKIESAGILVFQATRVEVKDMRGFSIADRTLPIIGINRKDSINGRIFTLIHEFIHIMLGKGGISDLIEDADRGIEDKGVEAFCNRAAAAALVPKNHFLEEKIVQNNSDISWKDQDIESLARKYSVSNEVILRRLLVLGRTSQEFYANKRYEFIKNGAEIKNERKADNIFKRNIPNETFSNLGNSYVKLVFGNYYRDNISLYQLSNFLGGIKIKHIKQIETKLRVVNG